MPPFIFAYFVASVIVGFMGHRSQIGFWGFFFLSCFTSPIIGFTVLMLASNRKIPGHAIREHVVEIEYKDEK